MHGFAASMKCPIVRLIESETEMRIPDVGDSYFSFGNFPMVPHRLNNLRATLAVDLALLEKLNLASISSARLLDVIKAAATAKVMHAALSQSALPSLRETAFCNNGALNWSDALALMLERHPESAVVNLDLGMNSSQQSFSLNPLTQVSKSGSTFNGTRE
jgi:hypothetical protein